MGRLLALALAACATLLAAGCGSGSVAAKGNTTNGKSLFTQQCAACHALADAGAKGRIGPSLDSSFSALRSTDEDKSFEESTIRQVILDQIKYPAQREEDSKGPNMPANLVTGTDAEDVASYVAAVAGKPVAGGGANLVSGAKSGKTIFEAAGCGGCHTLQAAGSKGNVGPNLDQAKPSKQLAVQRVTNGMGVMPSFKGRLTDAQIKTVAEFVSSAAGK